MELYTGYRYCILQTLSSGARCNHYVFKTLPQLKSKLKKLIKEDCDLIKNYDCDADLFKVVDNDVIIYTANLNTSTLQQIKREIDQLQTSSNLDKSKDGLSYY